MIDRNNYFPVLRYIADYWPKIIFYDPISHIFHRRDYHFSFSYLGLPFRGMSSNSTYFQGSQFYWDTYFHILGLVIDDKLDLARDLVDNLTYLFNKFGLIPARSRLLSWGRSQPPFLTAMAWEIFDHDPDKDTTWLGHVMAVAEKEYTEVWTKGQRYIPKLGLSRYYPLFLPSFFNRYEAGWDLSSRFEGHGLNLVPVDLNCLLYRYERDLHRWYQMRGQLSEAKIWQAKSDQRKVLIDKYFWNEKEGYFFDFDRQTSKQANLRTLAGFFPLWVGSASKEQAKKVVENLRYFEYTGGLATTEPVPWKKRQWDYPNGWAPLQFIVIQGLLNYGYKAEAMRITVKWLDLNLEVYEETGALWEKYDVAKRTVGRSGLYRTKPGFGWTNAIFLRLLSTFS